MQRSQHVIFLVFLAVFCLNSSPVQSQMVSQTVVAPGDGWKLGNAMASYGNTLVVGDQSRSGSPGGTAMGAAYVYTLANGQWTLQATLTPPDGGTNDLFGSSVAIYGNTILVGALSHFKTGGAYLYSLKNGQWTFQQEFRPADGQSGDAFGCAVAISAGAVVVGACHHGVGSAGAVYAYAPKSSVWTLQAEITHNPTTTPYALFGYALALGPTWLIVGAPGDNFGTGASYSLTATGGSWSAPRALSISNLPVGSRFGTSVALSGNTAAIGAPGISAAYVFMPGSKSWLLQSSLGPFEGASIPGFGTAVALSASTLVVSAVNSRDIGAYVFSGSQSGWTPAYELTPIDADRYPTGFGAAVALVGNAVVVSRPCAALVPTTSLTTVGTVNSFLVGGVEAQDAFSDLCGYSVALSGNTLLSGAPAANADSGVVFAYTRTANSLSPPVQIVAPDAQVGDDFGEAIAFDGNTLVVGAPYAQNGAIYLYSYSAGVWTFVAKLTAGDSQTEDRFGFTVALSGNTVAVSAPGRNSDMGTVYVFALQGATWSQQAEIAPTGGMPGDGFGTSLALDQGNLLIGAPNANGRYSVGTGAAYFYTLSSGKWKSVTKLAASDGQFGADFGASVALSGKNAVVGAPGNGRLLSAVYAFTQGANGWTQSAKLNDGWLRRDLFGASLALSGNTLLVGAYGANTFTGAVYQYTLNTKGWSLTTAYAAQDGLPYDDFGACVALSSSGILIGSPYANSGAGSIYGF